MIFTDKNIKAINELFDEFFESYGALLVDYLEEEYSNFYQEIITTALYDEGFPDTVDMLNEIPFDVEITTFHNDWPSVLEDSDILETSEDFENFMDNYETDIPDFIIDHDNFIHVVVIPKVEVDEWYDENPQSEDIEARLDDMIEWHDLHDFLTDAHEYDLKDEAFDIYVDEYGDDDIENIDEIEYEVEVTGLSYATNILAVEIEDYLSGQDMPVSQFLEYYLYDWLDNNNYIEYKIHLISEPEDFL